MGKRKFKGNRLYNLVKLVVNVITVYALFFAGLGLLRAGIINRHYLEEFDKCTAVGGTMQVCGYLLDVINNKKQLIYLYLEIGVGLPIVFYGGLKLYNYLFPRMNK